MGHKVTRPSVIYAIRCEANGKIYVGRTQNLQRRMREHLTELKNGAKNQSYRFGRGPSEFQKDFNQYGQSAFEVYILERDVPPSEVHEREYHWISEYRATDSRYGYNKYAEKAAQGFSRFKSGLPPKVFEKGAPPNEET